MAAPDLVNLSALIDDAKCFALVRQHRWPEGVRCPACGGASVVRDGCDDRQAHRQRYRCKTCAGRFDDLTGTALAGHHQPLRVWVQCLIGANFRAAMASHLVELARSASARSLPGAAVEGGGCAEQRCDAQHATHGGEERVTQGLRDAPE